MRRINIAKGGGMLMNDKKFRDKSVLTVDDIQQILQLGKNTTYGFLKGDLPFPIIRIGHQIRIPSIQFFKWLDGSADTTTD